MSSYSSVSREAQKLVQVIKNVAPKLAVNLEFNCATCRDLGFVECNGRQKPCECREQSKSTDKPSNATNDMVFFQKNK